MKKAAWIALAALLLGLLSMAANASLQSEVDSWFDSSGYVNGASAGAYQSQAGGYYTGGNLSLRVPTREIGGWVSVTPPRFEGGCGGIDLDLGGFNMVNKDQIVQQLRAIGQNAKALAFTMAIKYISSLLGSTMETIKGFADGLNKMQLDSCEAAAGMLAYAGDGIGGMMGKEKEGCIQVQVSKNGLSYDEARTACTSGGGRASTMAGERNARYFTNGNMAWFVMMQSPWLRNDLDTAEILMNLTGTVIVEKDGVSASTVGVPTVIPPMALENCGSGEGCMTMGMQAFLDALVFGGDGKGLKGDFYMFKCDPTTRTTDEMGCGLLQNGGKPVKVDLSGYPSIKGKVRNIVASIYQKVYDRNSALTADEIAFVGTVSMPIYRYILTSASAFRRTDPAQDFMLDRYLDSIAREMVASNLAAMLDNVRTHMTMDKTNTAADGDKNAQLDNILLVQKSLLAVREQSLKEMDSVLEMQEMSQKYERVIVSRMSAGTFASSMFGR